MGESVATDCIVAGGMSELGALTESLLSDGGKCRGGGEDVGKVRAAHERRRRDINQVVREAEVRASNQIIYGWIGAEGCTVRQATLHSGKQCRTQLAMRRRQAERARCCKAGEARSVERLGNKHDQLIRERRNRARLLMLRALGETLRDAT